MRHFGGVFSMEGMKIKRGLLSSVARFAFPVTLLWNYAVILVPVILLYPPLITLWLDNGGNVHDVVSRHQTGWSLPY